MKINHNLYLAPIVLFALLTYVQLLYAQDVQICRNDITPTTPDRDFTLHGDGTVTHHKTGLMWMRCALGQNWNGADCTGSAYPYNWQDALRAADGFSFAGRGDWRLPDVKELGSIVEQACVLPATNKTIFPVQLIAGIWSASPDVSNMIRVWGLFFAEGTPQLYGKTSHHHVLLVRGGQ
ncbi:MAG: DUF1566 domain-containing protein [Nitrosomonas sp.]|nr:DUF1566 domain-containing protein [Nitrosomonas sp.]